MRALKEIMKESKIRVESILIGRVHEKALCLPYNLPGMYACISRDQHLGNSIIYIS